MLHPRTLADVHAELADEHRTIMSLVSRLEAADDDAALPELLESLHGQLVDHFAHEQFPGGLYECMGARDPRWHDQLQVLVRDHCEVLSSARALVERARLAPDAGSLRDDVARLVGALRDHELREHRLVEAIKRDAAHR